MSTERPPGNREQEPQVVQPRSRALLYKVLAVLWIFPKIGAAWVWFAEWDAFRARSRISGTLSAVAIEQWVALVLVLLQGIFAVLGFYYGRKERGSRIEVMRQVD